MDNQLTIQITCQSAVTVGLNELNELHHYKRLEDSDYAKCRNSMTDPEIGFSFPISIWTDESGTKWTVDGHQRIRTLKRMQDEGFTIPPLPATIVIAPDKKTAAKRIIASDSKYGDIIESDFTEFLSDYDIDFSEVENWANIPSIEDNFWSGDETGVTEDEAPPVSDEPAKSELGKVYQLGRHRVMCGDATKIEDVEKLMNGQKADMVFTDPPYGIEVVQNNSVGGGKLAPTTHYSPVIGDDTIQTALGAYSLCVSLGVERMVFWGGNYYAGSLPNSRCWIVWNKKNTGNFADAELAWTNLEGGVRLYDVTWNGMIREGESDKRSHPTQKPIKLGADILKDYTNPEQIVLDLFGGSGSMLIACEQTNRTCYMMELDPKYVDVIRKRYAKFINQENEWETTTPEIQ